MHLQQLKYGDDVHLSIFGDCLEVKREYYHNCLYWQRSSSSMGTVNRNSSHSPFGPGVLSFYVYLD